MLECKSILHARVLGGNWWALERAGPSLKAGFPTNWLQHVIAQSLDLPELQISQLLYGSDITYLSGWSSGLEKVCKMTSPDRDHHWSCHIPHYSS